MSRIADKFDLLGRTGSGAFIPYVCAGDPECDFTLAQVQRLDRAGADIIELGMPFSDPVADGPVIQRAMVRSLSSGFRTKMLFDLVSSMRNGGIDLPVVLMTYYNPLLRFGVDPFCKKFARSGGDGLLVVDLPPEESEELDSAARHHGLDVVRLVAPSTPDSRIDIIAAKASGFVYAVSVAGTTGARERLSSSAGKLLGRVRARCRVPVVLGFGVSTPDHVKEAMSMGASGVVEGSKLISIYSDNLKDRSNALDMLERHARTMKEATLVRNRHND